MKQGSEELGTLPIPKLLVKQSVPAAMGFLVMGIYTIVDTIFVGRYVGSLGIAGITVVLPISFLMASVGMAIGIGGASVISRAFGAENREKAFRTFGNQIVLTVLLSLAFVALGFSFSQPILTAFGAKGDILPYAVEYFSYILPGIPFLAWAMMSNNVIRAEGKSKRAMFVLIIPAVVNVLLDPIFIVWLKMGMTGAAVATTISYILSALYTLQFFLSSATEMKLKRSCLRLELPLIKEIFSIGGISIARQGVISLLTLVLNNSLFHYGSETSVAVFGIINRVMMFILFPVIGIMQGFMPIAGYNYGAAKFNRVKQVIRTSLLAATVVSGILFLILMLSAGVMAPAFTLEDQVISETPWAMRVVFLATPIIAVQLIGGAYYQAIGKPWPALFISLSKQGIFLIPLVLLLPRFLGLNGIWISFPVADILAAIVSWFFLRKAMANLDQAEAPSYKL